MHGHESVREAQRKRQNEYSQALAEQVRAQEAKKKAERDAQRFGRDPPEATGGLFAGMGSNHAYGKNHARGHHVEKMVAAHKAPPLANAPPDAAMTYPPGPGQPHPPLQYQVPAHQPAPGQNYAPQAQPDMFGHPPPLDFYQQQNEFSQPAPPVDYFPPQAEYHQQPPWGYHSYPPQQYAGPPMHGHGPSRETALPQPPPMQPHSSSPPPPSHAAPPGTSHGRRHMLTNDTTSNKKAQQAQAQALLQQQMEDNKRRKAEEKRKKDEEDRLELQRIEKELQRQAEQYELEKQAKAREQQLKAQALEQDLKARQAPKKTHTELDAEVPPNATPEQLREPLPPDHRPPPLELQSPPPPHGSGFYSPREAPWQPQAVSMDARGALPLWSHPQSAPQWHPPQPPPFGFEPTYQPALLQPSPSMPSLMDERLHYLTLELSRQRALVEQLVYQKALPAMAPTPTVEDLERLRHEMQAELDRRDQMHQLELERLRHEHANQMRFSRPDPSPRRKPASVSFHEPLVVHEESSRTFVSPRHSPHHSPSRSTSGLPPPQLPPPQSPQGKAFPGNAGTYNLRQELSEASPQRQLPAVAVQQSVQRSASRSQEVPSPVRRPQSPVEKPFPGVAQYNFQATSSGLSPKGRTKPAKAPEVLVAKAAPRVVKTPRPAPRKSPASHCESPAPPQSAAHFNVVNLIEDAELPTHSAFVASQETELPAAIIECDSQMIYFDGRVDDNNVPEAPVATAPLQRSGIMASAAPDPAASFEKHVDEDDNQFIVVAINDFSSRYTEENQLHDSFDIDEMYQRNCERSQLLDKMEEDPSQVSRLVSSLKAMAGRRATPKVSESGMRGNSLWVQDTPRWLAPDPRTSG
ncbi:hypothetical protein ACHHYP_07099 [Achlya hypogyna]|uniref:Uncharacterized protein n=1 Tax=Achlya hypogyna TaxID=1202772 RepID=A0A1V9ZMS8_ACHHY|nr:hypothetical protein ACHHYP_07099 [Achlya hypogyna]